MGWTSGDRTGDRDTTRRYEYNPSFDLLIDRDPDHRPSDSRRWIFDRGQKVGCVLEIKDDIGTVLGVLILVGEAEPSDPLGKIQHGVSLLSMDDIRYS